MTCFFHNVSAVAERVAANGGSSTGVVPTDGVSSRSSDRDDVDEAEMDREANGGEEERNSTGKQEDEEKNEVDLEEEDEEEFEKNLKIPKLIFTIDVSNLLSFIVATG